MRGVADSLNVVATAAILAYEARRQRVRGRVTETTATRLRRSSGPARPARRRHSPRAARGASVAIVDRRWFGGSCPHIGCVPSKALLHAAAQHHANPATYDWPRASARRDYMVNRPVGAPEPDDSSHVQGLRDAGALTYRGAGRIAARGRRGGRP